MEINIVKALKNPAAVFSSPDQLRLEPTLSREQKIQILKRWEYDERELAVAEEENMAGGPPGRLDEILQALQWLEADETGKPSPPTKQGGH